MSSFSIQTDQGARYADNEDTVGYDESLALWLVADGMGGHAAGEVASQIARDTLIERIRSGDGLAQAALASHSAIACSADSDETQQGMGSTIVALRIADCHAGLVWVGDSRAYLWRSGNLSVATHDHSYVQMLIDQGLLTDETARDHPRRNTVTQILGLGTPNPETRSMPLQTGDWLVLCSDGLNDELTDDEIAALLESSDDVEQVADLLVTRALEKGGRDNVSVIAVEYDGPTAVTEAVAQGSEVRSRLDVIWKSIPLSMRSPIVLGITAAILMFVIFLFLKEA